MTLPTGVWAQGSTIPRLGVVLALFPLESEFNLEVQRAPDDGGGDPDVGSAIDLTVAPPNTQVVIDALQNVDTTWHYRWRHTRDNYTDGAYTPWIAARARSIPRTLPPLPRSPLLDASLSLSSSFQVIIEVNAEPWVRSVQWEVDTSGTWPDLDDGGASCSSLDANGDATLSTGTTLTPGQTARVELRFYGEAGCAGNPVGTLRISIAYETGLAPPTVTAVPSQLGAVGTATLVISDLTNVVATSFDSQSGAGDFDPTTDPTSWPGYDNTDPYTVTQNVALVEGHNSVIAWGVAYNIGDGVKWITDSMTLDADEIPDGTLVPVVAPNGDASCNLSGKEDSKSWKVAASVSATPSDATVRAESAIDGRNLTPADVGVLLTALPGQTVFYKAFGYSAVSAGGNEGPAIIADTASAATVRLEVDVTVSALDVSFTARAYLGDALSGVVEFLDPERTFASAGSITATDKTLTISGGDLTDQDVGKYISVAGAGAAGALLESRIDTVTSAGVCELEDAAGTTVGTATVILGGGFFDDFDYSGTPGTTETNTRNRPDFGLDTSYITLRAVAGGQTSIGQTFLLNPVLAPTISEVQAEGHDDTSDIDWELRWVNEGSTNSTDHDLTIQYLVDGVLVEQQTGVSVDESQPYSHSTTGAGGLPGGELGSAKFLLELKSNNRPVDTQESRGLILTT